MGRMDGKVALVTGAARGQGRSHALRLAQEGADIIGVDLCKQIDTVPYPMAVPGDLEETVGRIEELDRRIVAREADVRSSEQLRAAVDEGLSQFGHIDVVCANAGIFSTAPYTEITDQLWDDMIAVNLTGVFRTVQAVLPHMIERGQGGSVIMTSSTAGIMGFGNFAHYTAAKHGVVGLMRTLVQEVSAHNIRVNTVHPTSVNTDMIQNPAMYSLMSPDNPTKDGFGAAFTSMNALPIPWVEPVDISNAVLFLASDESRYVTGQQLKVDAGFCEKTG
ncbi:mycofactocin-coupled SDR family oxidoreductase [Pseudonocardia sp. KRD291]|uniref:mycofactocin-coupled SDR family oxidoreductase n=1 Tax=Pseudonocardia sp. KRD291 TaxID=2792007 RepID=UPI001C4A6A7E|nr:mycofactocin-coupled SDR family oxidoreductase [Pseudonocardia sp. KRD291]MBW0105045.1 mycofactocin-coupled SDR family oxidoreductase [Pseudonocardia sp. KRD291]